MKQGTFVLTYDRETEELKRSISALRGWGTKYRKEVAFLKEKLVNRAVRIDHLLTEAKPPPSLLGEGLKDDMSR